MSENCHGGRELVGQALLECVGADLRRGCHAQALDQRQDGPDNPGEDRGAIWIFRAEVRLHADHPQRPQARGPQARPVYHCKRDSIEAHLTIVFAALAVSRWIEARTGWSIRKFVKTASR